DLSMARTLGSAVPSPEIGDNIAALIDTIPAKSNLLLTDGKIVLEEFTFSVTANAACQSLAQWVAEHVLPQDDAFAYWRAKIAQDLVVLSDDDFCDFVSMSTEVITRTKISSETGTVQSGMLWTEEYLPADSMLYTLALASDPFDTLEEKRILKNAAEIMDFFTSGLKRAQHIFQLGGNATIGKGLVRVTMMH
ncbi:MAG: type III-B CRISPR module RAMP protein Cmr4, partial [Candidatus Vecturithrix sp.]|nr:type III-B CRISPR module RAMP protein Cmr4 [Candidatus Vecturithrix sp.]